MGFDIKERLKAKGTRNANKSNKKEKKVPIIERQGFLNRCYDLQPRDADLMAWLIRYQFLGANHVTLEELRDAMKARNTAIIKKRLMHIRNLGLVEYEEPADITHRFAILFNDPYHTDKKIIAKADAYHGDSNATKKRKKPQSHKRKHTGAKVNRTAPKPSTGDSPQGSRCKA